MNILVIGAGMMGRAIAFDLANYSNFEEITISDKDKKNLKSAKKFLKNKPVSFNILDIEKRDNVKSVFQKNDFVISAIPYHFNYILTKIAIDTKTHFLDLGGNNSIVENTSKIGLFIRKLKNVKIYF